MPTPSTPQSIDFMPQWQVSPGLTPYPGAMAQMQAHVEAIIAGTAPERVWLLEHPALFTIGTSGRAQDVLMPDFPVFPTGRGGQVTYHGPGQRVAYVMLDLKRRNAMDVRAYVAQLEQWLIATLAHFGVAGFVREGRVGVWVHDPARGEAKIAALGIRIRKWVTFHGVCLNVCPDLSHYAHIIPCGIAEYGVTSLAALGVSATMEEVDAALRKTFNAMF